MFRRSNPQLDRIEQMLANLTALVTLNQRTLMADLSKLTADVDTNTTVIGSAITLINNLAAQIKAAGTDPAALDALATKLEANSQALAQAITANTPAA